MEFASITALAAGTCACANKCKITHGMRMPGNEANTSNQ